jgi:hypothetical protein
MQVDELFVRLGVSADTIKLNDFVRGLGAIPIQAAMGIAALAGLSLSIKDVVSDAMDLSVSFKGFEAQTGLSAQALQRWQNVALQANVSAEAVTSSVAGLQRQLADISLGRGNIAPFQMLGISPRSDAFSVLATLRGRVQGMDRAMATNFISQMGLAPEMMNVLTLSDKKFREFSGTVIGLSPKQAEAFLHLRLELNRLKMAFQDTFSRMVGSLLPVIQPFIDRVLPRMAFFVENIVSGMVGLATWIGNVKGVLPGLGLAIAAIAAVFAPWTIAVAGLILLFEDLAGYFSGNAESLTGHVVEGFKTMFDQPRESLEKMIPLLGRLQTWLQTIKGSKIGSAMFGIDMMTGNMGSALTQIGEMLVSKMPKAGETIVNIVVNSTAEAMDVATEVARQTKAALNEASLQTGNQ